MGDGQDESTPLSARDGGAVRVRRTREPGSAAHAREGDNGEAPSVGNGHGEPLCWSQSIHACLILAREGPKDKTQAAFSAVNGHSARNVRYCSSAAG